MADPTEVNGQITDRVKESGPQEMPGRAAFEAEDKKEGKA